MLVTRGLNNLRMFICSYNALQRSAFSFTLNKRWQVRVCFVRGETLFRPDRKLGVPAAGCSIKTATELTATGRPEELSTGNRESFPRDKKRWDYQPPPPPPPPPPPELPPPPLPPELCEGAVEEEEMVPVKEEPNPPVNSEAEKLVVPKPRK